MPSWIACLRPRPPFSKTSVRLLVTTLLVLRATVVSGFLIGGCIGPKKSFERYLNDVQRRELTRMIEARFDGRNKESVLQEIDTYLKNRLTASQWETVEPEIRTYRKLNIACSPYSQLLPPKYFKPLLHAVRRAVETGADRKKIKYLVEDYLDRVLFTNEFVKEFRKEPPVGEKLQLPLPLVLRPRPVQIETASGFPTKPLFPIVQPWNVFPRSKDGNLYYRIG